MDIGAKIRAIRKSRGFTQIEVADKAKIAVNSLRNYEANKRQPNMEQLRAIADALDVSLSELIWQGEGPAPEPLRCVATPHGAYIVSGGASHNQDPLDEIAKSLAKLNPDGQQKAVERVEELTEIPKYKK